MQAAAQRGLGREGVGGGEMQQRLPVPAALAECAGPVEQAQGLGAGELVALALRALVEALRGTSRTLARIRCHSDCHSRSHRRLRRGSNAESCAARGIVPSGSGNAFSASSPVSLLGSPAAITPITSSGL
jgi:hypothetical protein